MTAAGKRRLGGQSQNILGLGEPTAGGRRDHFRETGKTFFCSADPQPLDAPMPELLPLDAPMPELRPLGDRVLVDLWLERQR
jgi:hypothetical protein